MSGRPTDTTLALLGTALRQASDHIGGIVTLARTEIDGNLRALFNLLAPFVLCVLLIVAALLLFLVAVEKALAAVIGSEVWAALVVAAPFLACSAALARLALRRMAVPNPIVSPRER